MIQSVSAQQARELISRGEVEIVDVRDAGEWSGGHIAGAQLVPLSQIQANPAAAVKRDGVLFVCAAGMRSQTAARLASNLGFKKVYSLNGGTRGWVKAGFELVNDLSVAV